MRTFVIGDIHGAYKAFKQCLKKADFNYKKDKGTTETINAAIQFTKPYLELDLSQNIDYLEVSKWLEENKIKILNIAGPRESYSPGIYEKTKVVLENLFS